MPEKTKLSIAQASRFNVKLINYPSMFALDTICGSVLYSTASDCIAK